MRSVATALGVIFAVSLAVRALWWTAPPTHPRMLAATVAVFVITAVVAALAGQHRRLKMPLWTAFATLAIGVVIPVTACLALPPEYLREPYATWYIGAVGLLGVICIVRGRRLFGWALMAALTVESIVWIGLGDALGLGLVGSFVWMVVAQLVVTFWRAAMRDTDRLASIQQAASAWQATQAVRQRERRERVQYALSVAGPSLTRVIETRGDLAEEERVEARLAEGRLRDEIRGANLLNADARAAIEAARRRGATVTVFDEGGLDDLDEIARERIRSELADVLHDVPSARLIIRSARDAEVAVTVVGRTAAGESADDDSVELWREIRRTVREAREPDPPEDAQSTDA
ncbi:hypothetical protein GCM10025768_10260 [Microbacterium pseudoresistens]